MGDRAPLRAIEYEGETLIHATSVGDNYATLCGMSDDDEEENGRPAPLPKRPRLTCDRCREIILHARRYRIRRTQP